MTLPVRLFSGQISDFDLKLIRTFRSVADCSGFSLAEIELNMTKSAISKQIADLEIRLGVQLCHRGRSGFALTAEGQYVYDASTKMLGALEGFRTELSALQKHPTGTLHIGCIDSLVTSEKSPVLAILTRFSTDFPDVKIKIITTSSAEIDQSVADRRVQIGFSTDRGMIKGAKSISLFFEHSYLYCGRNHPLFEYIESDLSLDLLNEQRFAQHAYSESELRDENKIGLTPAATGQFTEGIAMLILTGNYIGFLPQHYAKGWVDSGVMRPLLPVHIRKMTKIRLLFHEDAVVMPLVAAFVKTAETVRKAGLTAG
ncbi:DNA-binding transcriptional LysR family regulator [Pararhizobium capsulatum DSM 1112]|uniref:DNA-binding transcriptional LysR family regulator n=1 Tax=Pararhizobium capsulatum DSM 1112 TaxID=1121113 RepID=A0ABU0C1X3_9HYPH|nr:LysR family transcriptional regulator [Pararhizobium capsulatum]MDQ0323949.1 DNA-binding transcriptional LysR family regulator [Pararhizobium capsulatum DSM 1112]